MDRTQQPPEAGGRLRGRIRRIGGGAAVFFAVVGPGLITGSVDNDAGGITTYSVLGARFGYKLLWVLIPSFVALLVIQEMNARMGMVTRKGLADLIRENFGVRITFLIFTGLLIADIGNTATEFAGIAGSLQIFDISKYVSVPVSAVAVWLLVVKGTYKSSEKLFLIFSIFLFSYVLSAVLARPDWGAIGRSIARPALDWNAAEVGIVVGTIGTTIAPWMQFYMQAAVIEKGLTMEKYRYEIIDVVLGAFATVVVAFFIVIACAATLHPMGIGIDEAKDAALALVPLAGDLAGQLFALGLFIASIFAATILPIATAFYISEAFGFEAGVDKTWKEAPVFYTIFTAMILIGAGIILIPGAPLISITVGTQVLNGVLLPPVLIAMIFLINSRKVMGRYTNAPLQNAVAWTTVLSLIGLSVAMFVLQIAG